VASFATPDPSVTPVTLFFRDRQPVLFGQFTAKSGAPGSAAVISCYCAVIGPAVGSAEIGEFEPRGSAALVVIGQIVPDHSHLAVRHARDVSVVFSVELPRGGALVVRNVDPVSNGELQV
jgi:hypothetical protein